MYIGRDLSALGLIKIEDWKDSELMHFHQSLQQILPYLNAEGQSLSRKIVEDIERRGGLKRNEATYTSGTILGCD